MKDFYCIIQGQSENGYGWERLIRDKVTAEDKAAARKQIESIHNKKIPMRIKGVNVKPDSLLLSLYEIVPGTYKVVKEMFEIQTCSECGETFKPIDKYNLNGFWGGADTCSDECRELQRRSNFKYEDFNVSIPVIYKIYNIKTKMYYIGQTQRSFTLRWWEHIKAADNNKFHKALKDTELTDWRFSVVEVVKDIKELDSRELYWIKEFDSINSGYNTIKKKEQGNG
jgi:hypothetical protein